MGKLEKSRIGLTKVSFRELSNSFIGKVLFKIGIELNTKYQVGYLHVRGGNGDKENKRLFGKKCAFIEREDGQMVSIPDNPKYYTKLQPTK